MLKYLIQVVQNSLSTGILIAVLFAFVNIANKRRHMSFALGSIAGIAFALVLATLKHTTKLINREYWNIGVLSVSIVAAILFCLLSWGTLQKKSPVIAENLNAVTGSVFAASLLMYCLSDIFLYPTGFALSGESIFSTDFLFKMIGYLGGAVVVALASFALYRVSSNVSAKLLRVLLTVGIAVNILNQASTIVQFLLARRIIPMMKGLFAFIKLTINYSDWFLYAIMAATIIPTVMLWLRSRHPNEPYSNPAQLRKIRAMSRNRRRWCAVVLAGYLLSVLSLTAIKSFDEREIVLSPAEPMNIVGSDIIIPIETVSDGHLHRFAYTASNGTEVRFIVIKKNPTTYGVGLDACDICGQTGYYERDDEVICKLCDVVMNKSTIGFKGGCNPVPLDYSLRDIGIVIQTQSLEDEKKRFM